MVRDFEAKGEHKHAFGTKLVWAATMVTQSTTTSTKYILYVEGTTAIESIRCVGTSTTTIEIVRTATTEHICHLEGTTAIESVRALGNSTTISITSPRGMVTTTLTDSI